MAKKTGRRPKKKCDKQSERAILYLVPAEAKLVRKYAADRDQSPSAFLTEIWRQWRASQEA